MEARGGLGTRRADALVRMPSLRPPGGLRWGRPSRLVLFYLQKKIKKSLKARDSLRPRRADAQVRMPSLRPLLWAALGQTLPSRAF